MVLVVGSVSCLFLCIIVVCFEQCSYHCVIVCRLSSDLSPVRSADYIISQHIHFQELQTQLKSIGEDVRSVEMFAQQLDPLDKRPNLRTSFDK